MTNSEKPSPRRINIKNVEARVGASRSTIWRWCKSGSFPMPHYIGRRRAWWLHEIEAWEADRGIEPPPMPDPLPQEKTATAKVKQPRIPENPPPPPPVVVAPVAPLPPLERIAVAFERIASAVEAILEKQSPRGKK